MSAFGNKLINFIEAVTPWTYVIVAIALLAIGVMMIYPDERSKDFAKRHVPWVLIGSALVMTCLQVARWATTGF